MNSFALVYARMEGKMIISKKKTINKFTFSRLLKLFFIFLMPYLCNADVPFINGTFTIAAGPYRYLIDGGATFKYTQQDFFFNDSHFIRKGGQNSAVFMEFTGKYIGGYHTEGGSEEVISYVVTQKTFESKKGKSVEKETIIDPQAGETYNGPVSIFRKSRLANLELRETQEIDAEKIVITRSFTALDTQTAHDFYLFMWCWHPDFTDWYAELANGSPAEGVFTSDNGWKMTEDIKYTAIYNSQTGNGMLMFFPQVISTKPPRKATYWDVKNAYKKFYLFLNVPKSIEKGYKSPDYTVILQGFNADPGQWKKTVKKISDILKKTPGAGTPSGIGASDPVGKNAGSEKAVPQKSGTVKKTIDPYYGDISNEDWKENRRGIEALSDDYVFPVFSPVKADKKGKVEVWNRIYSVAPGGLPQKVQIGKEDFLKKPVDLELSIGKAGSVAFSAPELVKAAKGRVTYVSRAEAENASVSAKTTIEYDGMIRHDLTITPNRTASIRSLIYRVRIPAENARFYRYDGARTAQTTSVCIAKNTFAGTVPEKNGLIWQDAFKTLVWIGDNEKGFLWFAESEQHWNPQPREERMNACRIIRDKDEVILEIQPVSAQYNLTEPVTITCGFFATPVRPMPEGWRGWTMQYMSMWDKAKILYHQWEWRTNSAMYDRIPNPGSYRERVAAYAAKGQMAMPYFDMRLMCIGKLKDKGKKIDWGYTPPDLYFEDKGSQDSEWEWIPPEAKYYNEWRTIPSYTMAYGQAHGTREGCVSWQSGWADFFCYLMETHAELGNRGCANFDEWMPVPDMNELHGAGYLDQNGIRRVTYQTFAQRDVMKRICHIYLTKTGHPPVWSYHPGNTIQLPASTHFTGILNGESLNSVYHVNESFYDEYTIEEGKKITELLKGKNVKYWYYHITPPDKWQAEFYGQPYGIPVFMMGQYWKDPNMDKVFAKTREAERDYMVNPLLHDNLLFPVFVGAESAYTYFAIREKFKIAENSVVFHPYWAKVRPARAEAKDVLISAYQNKKSWLIIAANVSLEGVKTQAEINPQMIKTPGTIINAETDATLTLKSGRIEITLPPRDYVIIRIDEK